MKLKSLLILSTYFFWTSCKTDNKILFEKVTDIQIPSSAKTTSEYQDMVQDYRKTLLFSINSISKKELELSIRKSKFFNPTTFITTNLINEEQLIEFDNIKGLWYRNKTGYSFFGFTNNRRDNITASIDTIKMNAKFQYLSD